MAFNRILRNNRNVLLKSMRTSNIFVTVDIVILRKLQSSHHVLLIKRKNDPYRGSWALPGGFVDEGEDLQTAAMRELHEETRIVVSSVEQLRAFGTPGRDPRQHTVSIAFYAFVDQGAVAKAADDADDADWFDLDRLPDLAFDHADIMAFAKEKLQL